MAVVLRDVEDLTHSQIWKLLDPSRDKTAEENEKQDEENEKRDYSQVRQMIKRGQQLLEDTLGKDGWRKQIEAMKANRKLFCNLNPSQQRQYLTLVRDGMTEEEARQYALRFGREEDTTPLDDSD